MNISPLAHQYPQPLGFSEIERRDPARADFVGMDRRTPRPDRGSRNESLEAVRYLTLTMNDLIKTIQNKWPHDRPMPAELADHLTFGAFALTRVRNGALRRMAESAQP